MLTWDTPWHEPLKVVLQDRNMTKQFGKSFLRLMAAIFFNN
jgi:hypothetical protein